MITNNTSLVILLVNLHEHTVVQTFYECPDSVVGNNENMKTSKAKMMFDIAFKLSKAKAISKMPNQVFLV